ncbi:MAG TPA: creatininase family protein [Spirochaetia bacterium]|nr:creatininase family protein [Spirochaetia bacterium]
MAKVRYEEMLPHEIVAARTRCPIAYLPIGTIEWHGEHNPVGLDAVKIHALAMRCAETAGGLVFPALFYGEPRDHYQMEASHDEDGQIRGTMRLPEGSFAPGFMGEGQTEADVRYVELLIHVLKQLRSLGFKVMIIMAGHYPLLAHANAAAALYGLQAAGTTAWACTGYELVRGEIPDAGDHAAAWETSLMMVLRPDLVDLSRLSPDPAVPPIGIRGRDPRTHASVEYGRKGVDACVKAITGKALALLDQVRTTD